MFLLFFVFYSAWSTTYPGICASTFKECSWYFDSETKHLYVKGNGSMPNYPRETEPPWYFLREKIEKVTIEEFSSIGDSAFDNCQSLKDVSIPNSVTSIGEKAFYYCKSLQIITIPDSVTKIERRAFSDCESLRSINLSTSITSITEYMFDSCSSLQNIFIPNGVTSIEECAFSSCTSLQSFTIPNGVTSIANSAFSLCSSLQSITIPNSVTSIGDSAFSSCLSLQSISIPDSLTSISYGTFSFCESLTSISIPESVTSIEVYAFSKCTSLRSISIPLTSKLDSVDPYAFHLSESLTTLEITGSGAMSDYTETNYGNAPWVKLSPFIKKIAIENGITSIGDCSFYQMTNLETILIPETVTSIGLNSLSSISSLKTVYYGGLNEPQCENNYSTSEISVNVPNSYGSESNFCLKNVENNGFEGNCGVNCEWKIDSTFTSLAINGSGVMNDFEIDSQPWSVYKEIVNKVEIEGIISIGNYAFYNFIPFE